MHTVSSLLRAIAASAPIWFFPGLSPCSVSQNHCAILHTGVTSLPPPSQGPYQVVTKDFEDSNPNCSANIRNSWAALEKIADESKEW